MCGKRFGNGLKNMVAILLVLFCLSSVSLSAESNLYQELTSWSNNFETKLTLLDENYQSLGLTIIDYSNSVEKITLSLEELKMNSNEREEVLSLQDVRLLKVENLQKVSNMTLTGLEQFSNETEKTLKKIKVQE